MPNQIESTDDHNELSIIELRLLYDRLTSLYDGIKVKILALIAGEVAVVPFIFSGGFPAINGLQEAIFFTIGAALFSVSFGLLIWATSTADWLLPYGPEDSRNAKKLYPTISQLKEYIREDYEKCITSCLARIKVRARVFNITLWLFVLSLIILFVLKYT